MSARLEPITVNVKEAAEAVGVSTARMYELLNEGKVEGRYDKSKRLVLVRSLREYVETLPTEREAS